MNIVNEPGPWALEPGFMQSWLRMEQQAGPRLAAQPTTPAAPVQTRHGNILVIKVEGVLMPGQVPYTTDTRALTRMVQAATADPAVGGIILAFDTPGGNVIGVPELAAKVLQARKAKPVYGYVEGLCASAGYWVASCCTELYSTPSASIGSIGVYITHTDISVALDKAGLKQELISAGKYKTEGNRLGPLAPEGRAFAQAQVNSVYSKFVAAVAAGRKVQRGDVRMGFGQGRTLLAGQAAQAHMIDGTTAIEDVIRKLAIEIRAPGTSAKFTVFKKTIGIDEASASAGHRQRMLALAGLSS